MARWGQLARLSIVLALLASPSCASRPPSQAFVVPILADWDHRADSGVDIEPSACQKLCASAGQAQKPDRCHVSGGWSYHRMAWMVCYYGADE